MGTLRTPRKGNLLQQEVSLETTLLQRLDEMTSQIGELRTGVDGARGQLRDQRTILMGSGDIGETQYGRIPMLEGRMTACEAKDEAHESRLNRIEAQRGTDQASTTAHWTTAKVIWAFVAGCVVAAVGGGFDAVISWALRH